jgi:hypothetical protein
MTRVELAGVIVVVTVVVVIAFHKITRTTSDDCVYIDLTAYESLESLRAIHAPGVCCCCFSRF